MGVGGFGLFFFVFVVVFAVEDVILSHWNEYYYNGYSTLRIVMTENMQSRARLSFLWVLGYE